MSESLEIEAIHYETNKPVKLEIRDGLISDIIETSGSSKNTSLYVAPGLIDNQINGYNGVDFSGEGLTPDKMKVAVSLIRMDGVTTFQPTIITNNHKNLLRTFRNLARAIKYMDIRESISGFHLEGPYISPVEGFYGCHPAECIRKPSWKEFCEYQQAAEGKIRQITLAPESDGALEFIRLCVLNNIVVSIGHTNASAEQIKLAVDYGARLSTHLGNGCANLIDRHLNPLWPQLANDLLTPSIIADGHHLLPEEVQVFCKVKGPQNIVLTSDVTHLIGMPPGKYLFMGSEVIFTNEGLIKNPVLNCLAGASMPLRTGVGNVMKFTGCTLGKAVNMASGNVARIYNLSDRGSLAPGKRADLILFEMDGTKIKLKQVLLKGENVFKS
jgi:N-acetylglucosamine-6-phosphate deacetylase